MTCGARPLKMTTPACVSAAGVGSRMLRPSAERQFPEKVISAAIERPLGARRAGRQE
jgi:hypothetical protein